MMRLATLKAAVAGLAAVALASWAGPASAENDGAPSHGSCFTCGLATGYTPPPGIYMVDWSVYAALNVYSGSSISGVGVDAAVNVPLFQWVTPIKIANQGSLAFFVIPAVFKMVDVNAFGSIVQRQYGNAGMVLQADSSWPLGNGIAVDFHLGVGTPWGASAQIFDRYDFYPGFSLSYLGNGWNLTWWTEIEFHSQGTFDHQTPGDYFENEFTVVKDIGYVGVGLVGAANTQLTNDSGPGAGNSYEIQLGPYVQKAFGPAEFQVYWTHDVACQNIVCGDTVWLRFVAKLM